MAKQIKNVQISIVGETMRFPTGLPGAGTPANIDHIDVIYQIYDDADEKMVKEVSFTIPTPNLSDPISSLWSAQRTVLRSNEGI